MQNRTKSGVTEELSAALSEFECMKKSYEVVRQQLKDSESDITRRENKWLEQRKYLSRMVSKNFDIYLQMKRFSGGVKFNHNEETLHLLTQTDNSDNNTQCNDVRQLSGGERSYTTLCLLLALGLAVKTICLYL